MGKKDPWVDAYIAKAAPFAQPILTHIRALVHATCPEVEETKKWSFPHFDYKGSILCSMASFKEHASFGFWKASIMADPDNILTTVGRTSMGHLGQLTSLADLPKDKILKAYIKEAMRLNEQGINLPAKPKPPANKQLDLPDYFVKALKKNKAAKATFEAFSYSNKKEYVEWVTTAKSDTTKDSRLATAIEWMAEGKIKNWKYVK
jgi:uncharacterized protein YdeI (YjbR/CyaY-like superfamily)